MDGIEKKKKKYGSEKCKNTIAGSDKSRKM